MIKGFATVAVAAAFLAWSGFLAPDAAVAKISNALKTVMAMPEVRETLQAQGALATWTSVVDAEAAIRDENAKWRKQIKDSGIQAE